MFPHIPTILTFCKKIIRRSKSVESEEWIRAGPYRVTEDSFRIQRTRVKSHVSVASLNRALTGGLLAGKLSGFGFYYHNQKYPSLKKTNKKQANPPKVLSSITSSEEYSYFTSSLLNQHSLAYVIQLWHVLHLIFLKTSYKWISINNKYISEFL